MVKLMQSCSKPGSKNTRQYSSSHRSSAELTVRLEDLEPRNIEHSNERLGRRPPQRLIDPIDHRTKVLLVQRLAHRSELVDNLLRRPRLDDPLPSRLDLGSNERIEEVGRVGDAEKEGDLFELGLVADVSLVRAVTADDDVAEMEDGRDDSEEIQLLVGRETDGVESRLLRRRLAGPASSWKSKRTFISFHSTLSSILSTSILEWRRYS